MLKKHAKWDAAKPVEPGDLTGHEELFDDDARPCPAKKTKSEITSSTGGSNSTNQFGDVMQTRVSSQARSRSIGIRGVMVLSCSVPDRWEFHGK
ncbi:hypothetical protein Tco_1023735 [Tanacetum coccineum]